MKGVGKRKKQEIKSYNLGIKQLHLDREKDRQLSKKTKQNKTQLCVYRKKGLGLSHSILSQRVNKFKTKGERIISGFRVRCVHFHILQNVYQEIEMETSDIIFHTYLFIQQKMPRPYTHLLLQADFILYLNMIWFKCIEVLHLRKK